MGLIPFVGLKQQMVPLFFAFGTSDMHKKAYNVHGMRREDQKSIIMIGSQGRRYEKWSTPINIDIELYRKPCKPSQATA